jgi:ricin-type beta-trefoil lectin protein
VATVTTERELPVEAIEIRRSSALPRVNAVPSVELLSPAAPTPESDPEPSPDEAVAPAKAPSSAVLPRHRRPRKASARSSEAPLDHPAPRRRRKPVLLGAAGVAVLIAVPFVVLNSRPGHDSANSAANTLPSTHKPGAPAPTWAGAPSDSPLAAPPSSASPTPSAGAHRTPGGTSPNESVIGGSPRKAAGGHGSAGHKAATVQKNAVARPSHLLVGYQSNLCIAVVGGKPASKAHLVTWDCNGNSYERWTFEPDGTIRAMGMCMDVAWGSVDDGATIQLEYCHGAPAQHFTLYTNGDLVNAGSGKCVEVKQSRTTRGTGLLQRHCGGTSNQKWRLG